MTGPAPENGLWSPPAGDVAAVAADCRTRILEREGIPMFLALHDIRQGRVLTVHDALAVAEGERLAALFDHYEGGLSPSPDYEPELDVTGAGPLIDVLVVLGDQHLRARTEPTS